MPFHLGEVEVVNEVSLAPSAVLYDGAVVADGDLSVKVNAFYWEFAGAHGRYPGSCGNAVANNATNYVYLLAGNTLAISVVGYPGSNHIRLARVVTQGGFIVRVILERAFLHAAGSAVSSEAKAGVLVPGAFSGFPKKATVVFATPMATAAYAVSLGVETDGSRTFIAHAESKLATGFVVNVNANNIAGLLGVGWHVMPQGSLSCL